MVELGIPEENVGVVMAGDSRCRPAAMVQVASIDTLRNRATPPSDLVFVDEAHRANSPSLRHVSSQYPNAVHLGLTATPFRADGQGLCDAYDELLVVASPSHLIAGGYLVAPRIFTVSPSAMPDLSGIKVRGGDYDESELSDAVDRKSLVGNIVEHWKKHAAGVRTVAFAVSVAHSKHIAERFQEAGIPAEHLDGTTPNAERAEVLSRLDAGITQVVSNCSILCEGWDQPSVKCAILARPTKSTGLYIQQAGRILRPWNGKSAIILDHAGCVLEHGFPHDDREFTLQGTRGASKDAPKLPAVRVCEQCYAVLAAGTNPCPECGFVFGSTTAKIAEKAGELAEVTQSPLLELRAAWDQLCMKAAARGYKSGWPYIQFKARFGRSVPVSFPPPRGSLTENEKQTVFAKLRATEGSDAWARTIYRSEMGHDPPAL
jgi:superfamily II DNA or RNA helicase